MFTMQQATPADLDRVYAILTEAARWIAGQGIDQWTHYLTGEVPEDLAPAIADGEVYLLWRDGQPVATISLQMAPSDWDRTIWGETADQPAAYVHRLAVVRSAAGTRAGEFMLDWAEQQARAAGKRELRLDCVGQNDRLNAYYQKRFAFVGAAEQIGMTFHRYAKRLGNA